MNIPGSVTPQSEVKETAIPVYKKPHFYLLRIKKSAIGVNIVNGGQPYDQIREILRLASLGLIQLSIADSCCISKDTINRVLKLAKEMDICQPLDATETVAVLANRQIILSSFGLDADSVISSAKEISKLLATSQSLMNKEVPDDGEEQIN